MGEIVHELVRWATGSFTGVGGLGEETVGVTGGAAVGDGSTLGGGTTLEGVTTLGGGTTLGSRNVVGASAGGASAVVVVQLVKRLRSLEMANSLSWWNVVAASLTA